MKVKIRKKILFLVLGLGLLAFAIYAFIKRRLPDSITGSTFGLALGLIIIAIFPRKEKKEEDQT